MNKKLKISGLYKPLSDYVLMPYIDREKTAGGIVIPSVETVAAQTKGEKEPLSVAIERERAKRNEQFFFEVLATGPDVRIVKEGDKVLMAPAAKAAVFDLAGMKFVQCREYDLFAVVSQDMIEMDEAIRLQKANTSTVSETVLEVVKN